MLCCVVNCINTHEGCREAPMFSAPVFRSGPRSKPVPDERQQQHQKYMMTFTCTVSEQRTTTKPTQLHLFTSTKQQVALSMKSKRDNVMLMNVVIP